jgi:glycosyltransferase involved in cell wall biosynthesis
VAVSEPLLSVALPVRNGANFLAEALDSILAQTHADFVLHVSDNASDDATPEILAKYARRDPRVQVSRSAELIPQVANMNRAVGLAQSDWVKLFCHDDLMRPDCLQKLVAAIRLWTGDEVGLIGHDEQHLYSNGFLTPAPPDGNAVGKTGRRVARDWLTGRHRLAFPAVTTAAVRREAFQKLGGFDPRYVHFDTFLWLELLMQWDYLHLAQPLTTNRIHGAQVAATAHATLRTVEDYRQFLPEFVARHGAELALTPGMKLRTRMIPLGVAANILASEALAGRWARVCGAIRALPKAWLLPLAPLALRAWFKERRRLASLKGKVPMDIVYP